MIRIFCSAALLSLTACSHAAPAAPVYIGGQVTLRSGDSIGHPPGADGACFGMRGFEDITPGAQITIRDQHGTVLGTSDLSQGAYAAAQYECTFVWRATVPAVDFYQVEVSHRGPITVSRATAHALTANQQIG